MGSSCTCLKPFHPIESSVHPSSYHQSGYTSPKKASVADLKQEKVNSAKQLSPAPSAAGENHPAKDKYKTNPQEEEPLNKQRHGPFAGKAFGESQESQESNHKSKKGRKKIRQEERQVEVTTVQTIKETRIIHIEHAGDSAGENIDSAPTTTDDHATTEPQNTSADPTSPGYKVAGHPTVISRDYFPIKAKHIPEDLLKSGQMNTNNRGLNTKRPSNSTTGDDTASVANKHSSMETPYTRDCESPAPRYARLPSLATTSVVDSSVTEVEFTNPTAMKCASQKLRMLLEVLSSGVNVDKTTVTDSLSYAISVLDYNYHQKKRQALDIEESESFAESLSRATSVDNLVRDWLVSTFTRSTSRAGGYIDDKNANKKNFKSVANVIRISIMVDRFRRSLYRIMMPDYLKPYFKKFCYWDFDVFELHRVSGGHSLRFVCFEALARFGICTRFKIRRTVMEKFLNRLEEGYCLNRNPYHNVLHGADVTQGTVFYLAVTNLIEWLSELEIFTVIIASAIHDFEHTGTTNNFHINTKSDLALFYNDRSVLENYHVSSVFRFMAQDPETNIFTGLTSQEYKEMRALLIEIVLNTDMQFHFAQVKNMRTTLSLLDADPTPSAVTIDKAKVLSLLVHSSDVGHPGRSWPVHLKWTKMLCQEFFNQGDREKALEMTVSPLCDRLTTNIASSQIGFIDFIVNPTFDVVADMVERILNPMFLQHKSRSSANLLPTLEEGNEDETSIAPQPRGSVGGSGESDPLAGNEDYAAIAECGDIGEPRDYIPFKWDSRLPTLKIPRFYAKNIDNNKSMWRKHIEDEVNDPMYFKRFERDPVIELGWVWPAKEEKKETSGSENELKKMKKEHNESDESVVDEREARRQRRERQKAKIKAKEKEAKEKEKDKDGKRKSKHKEPKEKKHKHKTKEGEGTLGTSPHREAIAIGSRQEVSTSAQEGDGGGMNSDKDSVCGDLMGADDLDNPFDSKTAMQGDEDPPVEGEIAFDERDLDLGEYNESIKGSEHGHEP